MTTVSPFGGAESKVRELPDATYDFVEPTSCIIFPTVTSIPVPSAMY